MLKELSRKTYHSNMNKLNAKTKPFEIKLMLLLLVLCGILLSACTSTGDRIKTDAELIDYLAEVHEQDTISIKDSVEQGNYKLVALKSEDGNLGYALLQKNKKETYSIVKTAIKSKASHLLFQYCGANNENLLCVVNDGDSKKIIMSTNNNLQQRFELDKDSPAAYLFILDDKDTESFEYEFQNASGEIVKE